MEIESFEGEWHGIPFDGIPAVPDGAAAFYGAFYDRLLAGGISLDPAWVCARLNLAAWIETAVLRSRPGAGAPGGTVLSLGAGLGTMEQVWLEHGYRVSVQECQASSLGPFREAHPEAPVYIGDARHVDAPPGTFDVVVLSAIEHVYDRRGYEDLLHETARLLAPGGAAVMITVANLSFGGIFRGLAKRALIQARGDVRAHRVVRLGWKRTTREHLRPGLRAGLRPETLVTFDDEFRVTETLRPAAAGMLPLRPPKLAVIWSRV